MRRILQIEDAFKLLTVNDIDKSPIPLTTDGGSLLFFGWSPKEQYWVYIYIWHQMVVVNALKGDHFKYQSSYT